MSRDHRRIGVGFVLAAAVAISGAASQAAPVAMYGTYGETNGIIVNIPQNPPVLPCAPPKLTKPIPDHVAITGMVFPSNVDQRPNSLVNDARCHARVTVRPTAMGGGRLTPEVFNKPARGVMGAQILPDGQAGLNVGDPFTIPPFAFRQALGRQVGVVLNSAVRQLDTTFAAAMPATNRISAKQGIPTSMGNAKYFTSMWDANAPVGPVTFRPPAARAPIPALTRMFSQMNWAKTVNQGGGQNNGANATTMTYNTPFSARPAANTTHLNTGLANEKIKVRYVAGPRQFGGTMALLLDGGGMLWQAGPSISFRASFTNLMRPGAATQPVGDNIVGFRVRNADGWNVVHTGLQRPGKRKAFFGNFNAANLVTAMGAPRIAQPCVTQGPPPSPDGCNQVNGWNTFMVGTATQMQFGAKLLGLGGTVANQPTATSDKHAFPLTTGTVSIVRAALRTAFQGGLQTGTVTGMGYDTVGVSAMGGPQRNVGLVAGSYSVRTDIVSGTLINSQLLGVDLKFTPEPASSAALASGLGLLAALAFRRRSA